MRTSKLGRVSGESSILVSLRKYPAKPEVFQRNFFQTRTPINTYTKLLATSTQAASVPEPRERGYLKLGVVLSLGVIPIGTRSGIIARSFLPGFQGARCHVVCRPAAATHLPDPDAPRLSASRRQHGVGPFAGRPAAFAGKRRPGCERPGKV